MGRRIRHHQYRLSQRTIGFLVAGIGLTGILIASLITAQPGRNTAITADASQIADGRSLYVHIAPVVMVSILKDSLTGNDHCPMA